jgi:hypothetical protein
MKSVYNMVLISTLIKESYHTIVYFPSKLSSLINTTRVVLAQPVRICVDSKCHPIDQNAPDQRLVGQTIHIMI